MGLEAINYFFRSENEIKTKAINEIGMLHSESNKYFLEGKNRFYIDVEFSDSYSLSIRVTLCNPIDTIIEALFELFENLFRLGSGILTDMSTRTNYDELHTDTKEKLRSSYLEKRKNFCDMYGIYSAAISSEEFYLQVREH